jgi:hypothetical protein
MRALNGTLGFLLATLCLSVSARAHVPLVAPRVSLSLAVDGRRLARDALACPQPAPVPHVARHQVPRLSMTATVPSLAPHDVAAYDRVEGWTREVVIPHYTPPDVNHRRLFRQVYAVPYRPYLGGLGALFTVETDAILR